ncbi:MAG: methyltransferase FkbM [Burkholderiaceae bacterium]|nr:methyltransferase FkbM [Burkholderiaceae bacterium]
MPDCVEPVPRRRAGSLGPPGAQQNAAGFSTAYDQGLLDRARDDWRRGNWAALRALEYSDLQHHPHRGRLALLASAGHFATGHRDTAKHLIRMASEWGCERELIAQVLVAGLHNTLARASAAEGRRPERVLRHVEHSLALAGPKAVSSSAIVARLEAEMRDMGLKGDLATGAQSLQLPSSANKLSRPAASPSAGQDDSRDDVLSGLMKQQQDFLLEMRNDIREAIKQELLNTTKQLEAFHNLQRYLGAGVCLPELHGWAISPDFGFFLVQLIEDRCYDMVIEFGSGATTLLIAAALARCTSRRDGPGSPRQVAFEHLDRCHAETARLLQAANCRESVDLQLSPLRPYTTAEGRTFQYYDCDPALERLAAEIEPGVDSRILVLVDGPPGTTGPLARYPALPHVLRHFKGAHVDLLLDDYGRADERQVVVRWRADLKAHDLHFTSVEKSFEKGACLISFN